MFFNNNNRSPGVGGREVAQAATNADALRRILQEAELPVS